MKICRRNPGLPQLAALPWLLFAAFSAASPLRSHAVGFPREDISLSLREKVIRDLSSSGLTLAFRIVVTNRATSDRELVRYRYRVIINQREFLNMSVSLDEPLSVPGGRDTLIALPVKISYPLLFEAVGPVEEKALCDIVGDMVFADDRKREEKIGFAFPGEFPIFKDPEVDFLPLKVNDLTVGGADVVFRPRLKNLNGYELIVTRISYSLSFGEKEVLSGLVPGDKSLRAPATAPFPCLSSSIFSRRERTSGTFSRSRPCPADWWARSRSLPFGAGSLSASISFRPCRSRNLPDRRPASREKGSPSHLLEMTHKKRPARGRPTGEA